jgi:hypothetical protein|nr:MAG TPA: Flagellar assembly protein T, C-terminal domain [Caudoviricetes sp.]
MYEKYKVIAIQDEYTVLIDYGLRSSARSGDSLRIIEPGKDIVIDGKNYGQYDGIKAVIEVVAPYENFSVCKRVVRKNIDMLNPISAIQKTIARATPLNVEKEDISNSINSPTVTPIKVGDTVILTRE